MSKVLAKFRVNSIEEVEYYHTVGEIATAKRIKASAVHGQPFGSATPQGSIDMLVVNMEAANHFHVGKEYFVTFEEDTSK